MRQTPGANACDEADQVAANLSGSLAAVACSFRIIFFGLAVFFQLAPARLGKLVPGPRHVFELRAMRRLGGARHVAAFVGVLEVLVEFLHGAMGPRPGWSRGAPP